MRVVKWWQHCRLIWRPFFGQKQSVAKWFAGDRAPEPVYEPARLPVDLGHIVLQAVALAVVESVNRAVHPIALKHW